MLLTRCPQTRFLGLLLIAAFHSTFGVGIDKASEPGKKAPWRADVILWDTQFNAEPTWRTHESLQGRFHDKYPDDLQVLFLDQERKVYDLMWVRVIAYANGRYLGECLNQPNHVKGIDQGDNAVFEFSDDQQYPVAIEGKQGFRYEGLPEMAPPKFREAMVLALNAYRRGNFGHNPEAIEEAIKGLKRAIKRTSDKTTPDNRFFLHFFLARCYAEEYETLESIEHLKKAIDLRPDDEHAQMGLLAEYSLLIHTSDERLPAYDSHYWLTAFQNQVKEIRRRFPDSEGAAFIMALLSGELVEDKDSLTEDRLAEIAKRGSGTFRWKKE